MTDVPRGRAVPAHPTITLPDSGITIAVRKLSPMTMLSLDTAVRRDMPPPAVPRSIVDYGDGVTEIEPNPADPDYQAALAAYEQNVRLEAGKRFTRLVATYCLVEWDSDAVAALRSGMAAIGSPLNAEDDTDAYIYVWQIACVSNQDITTLQNFIMGQSQPMEAAVQAHAATFPDATQGPEHLGGGTAEIGPTARAAS